MLSDIGRNAVAAIGALSMAGTANAAFLLNDWQIDFGVIVPGADPVGGRGQVPPPTSASGSRRWPGGRRS